MDTERFERAIALRDAGKVEEALQTLTALADSTPDPRERASIILNTATCLTIMRRFDEARDWQREAVKVSPTVEIRASAEFGEAGITALEGNDAQALIEFESCLADAEKGQIPKKHICGWLAVTARSLGMKEDAERYDRLAER